MREQVRFKRKQARRPGRRPTPPLFDGPIPDNPEYRALVESILADKRHRERHELKRGFDIGIG